MKLDVVVDECGYLESPRWHDGALWLSDFDARHVLRVRDSEDPEVVAEIPNVPSGLAFTDTSLLVASDTTACSGTRPGSRIPTTASVFLSTTVTMEALRLGMKT